MANPIATSQINSYDNPYYLSTHDHSGAILVSDRLTGAADFSSWHQSMIMALNGRNKLCFADGSLPQPPAGNAQAAAWSRVNDVVRSWIIHSVSKNIGQSLLFVKTAHGMWSKLLKQFKQNNVPRLYQIEQKLSGLRQGSLDVSTFYTKLQTIWEDMKGAQDFPVCVCGACTCEIDRKWMDLFERNFVIKFLFGLNDSYETIRAQIIMMDPLPDLEKALNMVIQHEDQKLLKQTPQADAVIFQTSAQIHDTESVNVEQSEVIGAVGAGYKAKQRPLCTYCNLQGHTVNKCYKLHGYPPGYKTYSSQQQFVSQQQFAPQQQFTPQQFYGPRPRPNQFQQQQYLPQIKAPQKGNNVVGNVTNSPSVQDHFHQVSSALAQLSEMQLQQLAQQLTTPTQPMMPSINAVPSVNYSATSAGIYSGLDDWEG